MSADKPPKPPGAAGPVKPQSRSASSGAKPKVPGPAAPRTTGTPTRDIQARIDNRLELQGPAIALVELESIARGMVASDALLKRAPVQLAYAQPITPGKFVILFSGPVAEVEEALQATLEIGGPLVLDQLFLPYAAEGLVEALGGLFGAVWEESVGVVETHTVAAALLAADVALKRAEVTLMHLHLARGIGGKGYFTLTGSLNMVEAALEAAASSVKPELLVTTELIHSPHPELKGPML
jgi:microcompartment protein CcmL/EutN